MFDARERRQARQVARRHVRSPLLTGRGLNELFCTGPFRQIVVGIPRHSLHPSGVAFAGLPIKKGSA
jgi:hypothetical protein